MNKTKMILAGTGGAVGLVALVLAFFVWQAFSAKTAAIEGDDDEGVDGLETVVGKVESLSRSPIYPCAASVTAIESNRTLLVEWAKEAHKLASRGDRAFPKTTPAAFKTFLVDEAKRLKALPGAAAGKLAKEDFAFGPFKAYIAEGKLPSDAELAELQRKWDDVATMTELLAQGGVAEILDVQFKAASGEDAQTEGKNDRKDGKKGQRAKDKGQSPSSEALRPSSHSYVFTFTAKPVAFVKAVNALGTAERFFVVDDFTLTRPVDAIAGALGGDEKKADAAQSSGGRRGRRGRRGGEAAAPDQDGEKKNASKNGLVTDPVMDAPMTVTLTVTVHDFRSLEEGEKAEKGASK